MNRETKFDIIELSRAYFGVFLMGWWGLWSNANCGMPFHDMTSFVLSLGGIF